MFSLILLKRIKSVDNSVLEWNVIINRVIKSGGSGICRNGFPGNCFCSLRLRIQICFVGLFVSCGSQAILMSPQQDTRSPQQDTQSPQQDTQSPQQDTQSPQQDTRSPQQDTQSPQQDTQSPQQDTQSPQQDTRSPQQDTQSPQQDTRSPQQDTQSPQQDSRSPQQDTQSPQQDTRSPQQDSRTGLVCGPRRVPPGPILSHSIKNVWVHSSASALDQGINEDPFNGSSLLIMCKVLS
uniref:Uncharacterized protein n=1 Tax=Sphaeramia orbicularis TaxID=375764 RepID=A0A672YCT1_9TELE